ncbi:DUF4097 family beta strand repeat-containing protein [Spirillospora sp. NPDC029432]|uniref:DUF4097 family beta strand repeat-containing protein n=1 Tax=Spirillospora sp. NPDC029432 TaxID=3154599 RepID=UPI0034527E7A
MKSLTRSVGVLTGVAALTATSVLAGCEVSFFGSTKHETRSYDVPGAFTGLDVKGDSGRIEVVGTGTRTVRIEERMSWSNSRNKPRTKREVKGGMLTLRTACARQVIGVNGCQISYRIEVPKATMADLHADSGALSVSGLTGDSLRLSADSGMIEAEDVQTKRLTVEADSGKIRIAGRADVADLSNDSGLIEADGLRTGRLTARASSGKVDITLLEAPTSVHVENDSGAVKLRVPGDKAYAITVRTDSGAQRVADSLRRDNGSPHRLNLSSDSGLVSVGPLEERDGDTPERPEQPVRPDAPEAPDVP